MTLDDFREQVDRELRRRFGISWRDAGGGEDVLVTSLRIGETPVAFVRWWGEKYGLVERGER